VVKSRKEFALEVLYVLLQPAMYFGLLWLAFKLGLLGDHISREAILLTVIASVAGIGMVLLRHWRSIRRWVR